MAFRFVKNTFKKYPLISNCTVYGCMCVGAEFSQQVVIKKILNKQNDSKPIDTDTLKRYSVIGFLINPNILYRWYKWLDNKYVGTAGSVVTRKVLMDQFLMTPILYVIFYVDWVFQKFVMSEYEKKTTNQHDNAKRHSSPETPWCMSLMESKPDIFQEFREKFVPTFKTSCMFWLPATSMNFLLIPPSARVFYVGCCSFIWINILCFLKRQ